MNKNFFDTQEVVLNNGLRVISIRKKTQLFSINMGIKVGSLYENINEKGISHFIEHMLFKGTTNLNNEKLNKELEELGGEYNAYTDYNSTVYTITALNEEIQKSFMLLSDMIFNSTFPMEEIKKEKNVVLAEIRTSKDDVETLSFNRTNEEAFDNSPLKYDILGSELGVKNFTRNSIKKYYEKYYVPNNAILIVVSSFTHNKIFKLVDKYFSPYKRQNLEINKILTEKNKCLKKITYKKDIEQSTIVYLFTFYGLTKYMELALKVLSHRLGESSNSILFRKLREEKGLVYDVYSEVNLTSDVKTMYIYTSVDEKNIQETISTIDESINSILDKSIDFNEDILELMKKILKTSVAATLEDSQNIGNFVLHELLDGEEVFGFEEDITNINHLKTSDIYEVAQLVLKEPTIHIIYPEKSVKNGKLHN